MFEKKKAVLTDMRDEDTLSLDEFISLTENAFGGDKIRLLN